MKIIRNEHSANERKNIASSGMRRQKNVNHNKKLNHIIFPPIYYEFFNFCNSPKILAKI